MDPYEGKRQECPSGWVGGGGNLDHRERVDKRMVQ